MKIAVVGTGYVGLVTGTCFAETGNEVTCVDIDEAKWINWRMARLRFMNPVLKNYSYVTCEKVAYNSPPISPDGIKDAEIIFLALPTPPGEDGSADLKYVLGVADRSWENYDRL